VRAGLLPLVARGSLWPRTGLSQWSVIGPLMPGQRPLERLAEGVERALQSDPSRRDIGARHAQFTADPRGLTRHLRGLKAPDTGWLLVIDQFEELFTLAEDAERIAFDAALAEALDDADAPLFVVSTVRADFLDRIAEQLPRLAAIYNARCQSHLLGAISREGLREVIELPARLAGLDVSEVSTAILQDAEGEPGALPLVENALRLLWQQRSGARLSGERYRAQGGLAGMLSSAADELLARTAADVQQRFGRKHDKAALELLLALVKYDAGGRHTRRRISRDEALQAAGNGIDAVGERVLAWLSGQRDEARPSDAPGESLRLVVVHQEGGATHVDLIHETLVRARRGPDGQAVPYWKTLADYVEAHRDRGILAEQLSMQAERWIRARRGRRWFHLAGWGQLIDYRRLRGLRGLRDRHTIAARFLRSSQRFVAMQAVTLSCALAWAAWVWRDEVQDLAASAYNAAYYSAAMLWWTWNDDSLPVPEVVELRPLPTGQTFDKGCKPGRDDRVPGVRCKDDEWRPVAMPQPCAMGKYAVTNEQYNRFVWEEGGRSWSALGSFPAKGIFGTPDRPVVNVSGNDAQAYVSWLRKRTRQAFRLPSEAEWEYAARAESTGPNPWGDASPEGKANCDGCGGWNGGKRTTSVGSFSPNGWGLYDMVGNAWQWAADSAYGSRSNQALALRGGSWDSYEHDLRVALRYDNLPINRSNDIGFRVCRASLIETPAAAPLDAESPKR
jgi:hypothetical protein